MFEKVGSAARIFSLVYERGRITKQSIAHELGLSLPTVSNGLAALEKSGLVARSGTFPSTGGRPATAFALRPQMRFALGVELVADRVRLAAVDLYGATLAHAEERLAFERDDAYLNHVSAMVSGMLETAQKDGGVALGATIAIQGIVENGQRVSFAGLLGGDDTFVTLDDFARRLTCPVRLVHDAEAAAFAELWRHRELRDFAYLSLNDHLGSAIVHDGKLLAGGALGAGVAEHMVLHPHGSPCYCGNVGCAETVLGAKSLADRSGVETDEFFGRLRAGDARLAQLWDSYLSDLAILIHNVRMVACCDVVVGGRLARHFVEADLRALRMKMSSYGRLAEVPFRLVRGHFGSQATVIGAGLLPIEDFLRTARA